MAKILQIDGFEPAIIGIGMGANATPTEPSFVYDYELMVKVLMERDGMSEEEAVDYLDFNVIGVHLGSIGNAPIILFKQPLEDSMEYAIAYNKDTDDDNHAETSEQTQVP